MPLFSMELWRQIIFLCAGEKYVSLARDKARDKRRGDPEQWEPLKQAHVQNSTALFADCHPFLSPCGCGKFNPISLLKKKKMHNVASQLYRVA